MNHSLKTQINSNFTFPSYAKNEAGKLLRQSYKNWLYYFSYEVTPLWSL